MCNNFKHPPKSKFIKNITDLLFVFSSTKHKANVRQDYHSESFFHNERNIEANHLTKIIHLQPANASPQRSNVDTKPNGSHVVYHLRYISSDCVGMKECLVVGITSVADGG